MNLSNLLSVAGGVAGLAASYGSDDTIGELASGAAIVSGVAGATGNTNLQKIAGIAALGAGAYDAFSSSSDATKAGDTSSAIDSSLKGDRGNTAITDNASTNPGGPSGTGQSFSDAASSGAAYNGGLPGASNAGSTTNDPSVGGGVANTITKPSLLDSAKSALSGVGTFVHDNKDLVSIAGGALNSAFGQGAQQTSLLKAQLKLKQDAIDRQVANSNNLSGLVVPVSPNPQIARLVGGG